MITQEKLKNIFTFDGKNLIWKKRPSNRVKIGDVAGCLSTIGYLYVAINGKKYLVHRLIWIFHHGENTNKCIDHINGIKTDNRIENLREATRQQNNCNRGATIKNKLSIKGVFFSIKRKKYVAQIGINGKHIFIGHFDTVEDAKKAYADAAAIYHKEFAKT